MSHHVYARKIALQKHRACKNVIVLTISSGCWWRIAVNRRSTGIPGWIQLIRIELRQSGIATSSLLLFGILVLRRNVERAVGSGSGCWAGALRLLDIRVGRSTRNIQRQVLILQTISAFGTRIPPSGLKAINNINVVIAASQWLNRFIHKLVVQGIVP